MEQVQNFPRTHTRGAHMGTHRCAHVHTKACLDADWRVVIRALCVDVLGTIMISFTISVCLCVSARVWERKSFAAATAAAYSFHGNTGLYGNVWLAPTEREWELRGEEERRWGHGSEGWERVAGRGRQQEPGAEIVETEDEMLTRSSATSTTNFISLIFNCKRNGGSFVFRFLLPLLCFIAYLLMFICCTVRL